MVKVLILDLPCKSAFSFVKIFPGLKCRLVPPIHSMLDSALLSSLYNGDDYFHSHVIFDDPSHFFRSGTDTVSL